MNFAACPCDCEDGCERCGYTRSLRQCETCGEWFACERPIQPEDYVTPWSCPGCWESCHGITNRPGTRCQRKAVSEALVWTEDSHPAQIERYAVRMLLCRECFESAKYDNRVVAGTVRKLTSEGGK